MDKIRHSKNPQHIGCQKSMIMNVYIFVFFLYNVS